MSSPRRPREPPWGGAGACGCARAGGPELKNKMGSPPRKPFIAPRQRNAVPMVEVDLDETAKGILMATLASPKTAGELTRIFGLGGAVVIDYLELLEHLGLVRVVLSYFGRDWRIIRYYEADLPIDTSDLGRKERAMP